MRAALATIDRTPNGLLLHFPDQPGVRADLATFAVDEKQCCRFWGFEIVDEPGGPGERGAIALRWDGRPAAGDLLERLHAFFTTDAPISTLDGLL